MQRKRDIAYECTAAIFDCVKPQGAFYLFPDVSSRLRKNESAAQLTERILMQANVAVVPGEAFGAAGHIRISFGVSEDVLTKGLDRLVTMFRR
jgi:aspartate aminotransferase